MQRSLRLRMSIAAYASGASQARRHIERLSARLGGTTSLIALRNVRFEYLPSPILIWLPDGARWSMGEGGNKSNQPPRPAKTCGVSLETLAIITESGLLCERRRMNTTSRRAPKRDGGLRLSKNLRRTRKGRTLSNFHQQRVRWNGTTFCGGKSHFQSQNRRRRHRTGRMHSRSSAH